MSPARRRFSDVSGLEVEGPGRFRAVVDAEWTIAGKPNGGYLLAMLGRAASAVAAQRDVVAASAHYLRAPEPGPVEITATVLRSGRTASQVQTCMGQGDRACVAALVTTATLDAGTAPRWAGGLPAPGEVPFDDCVPLAPRRPVDGADIPILDQVEVRLEPASCGFSAGAPSGRGELRGWLSLPGGEAFDPAALLFAVDAFPPATFDVELSGWVPTLELTVYVRAQPANGPVRVLQRAQLIEGRWADEACFVWDADGRLVAQGTQLAAIRLEGSRPG